MDKIICDCEIEKKQFKDKDDADKVITYYDLTLVVNGQRIKVKPITESKQLLNYLLSSLITD